MGDVASEAGVSKALVHYHFHDKDSLLVALADATGRAVIARERTEMDRDVAGRDLDAYWKWLAEELVGNDVRILLALADYDSERVRTASRAIAGERRTLAEQHIGLIFSRLGLTPRVPASLMADTLVAFIDGIAAAQDLLPERDPRPAFDVLWLGLLSLGD